MFYQVTMWFMGLEDPNMAQAGIKAPEKLPSALTAATEIVREKLAN